MGSGRVGHPYLPAVAHFTWVGETVTRVSPPVAGGPEPVHNLPQVWGVPVRNQACLVWIAILVICVPIGLRAADRGLPAASPVSLSVAMLAPVRSEEAPAAYELFDESPLDLPLVILAAWLPIAAAYLALLMEDSPPSPARAQEPGGEISLD